MEFANKTIDYCSSKLKYNKRFMRWNLKGHPLKFSDKRLYFLILLLLLPTIEMAICIHVVKDIYLSIVVFHLTITLGPIIYLFLNSKFIKEEKIFRCLIREEEEDNDYWDDFESYKTKQNFYNNNHHSIDIYNNSNKEITRFPITKDRKKRIDEFSLISKIFRSLFSVPQFLIGLILMIVGLAFGLLCYYLLAYYIPNVVSRLYEYGMLSYSFFAEYIFYIYFSVVNPILEEWFWRMFLLNTFGNTTSKRLIITVCYSLYHFVVLTVFYNILFSAFLTLVVFIGGILFLYITKYVGPLASILSHTAADIMIVFIISNMTLKWLPYLQYN